MVKQPCHQCNQKNAERHPTVQRRDVYTCDRPMPAAAVAAGSQSRLQTDLPSGNYTQMYSTADRLIAIKQFY